MPAELEQMQAEMDDLKKQRERILAELGRIKVNLQSLPPGQGPTEDKLRRKYLRAQPELEAKAKAISKLIESKEGQVAELGARPRKQP